MSVAVAAGAAVFTVALYWACSALQRRLRAPLLHPLVLSVVLGGVLFALLPPRWLDLYLEGSAPLVWLLGPATAALALPFYRRRAFLVAHPRTAVAAVLSGMGSTVAVVWGLGALLGIPPQLLRAATVKSVTLPVALGLTDLLRTQPALTTVCVFATGLVGAAIGPTLLDRARVHAPIARGLALGTLSHAVGTARALEEDPLAGAAGVVALTLSALLMAAVAITAGLFLR